VPADLVREPLDCALTATQALLALRGDDRPFALMGAWAGGGAVLGSAPVRVAGPEDDLFARLDDLPQVAPPAAAGAAGAEDGFGGGWVGFLGFGLRHAVEPGHPSPPRPVSLPGGVLAYYDHVLRRDAAGRWWFEALVTAEREAAVARRRAVLAARLARAPAARAFATRGWEWTPSPAAHARAVQACRARIAAGDLYQANLCLRLEGRLAGDAIDLFAAAAEALPTERAAFLAGPWGALASLSPELFLARRGRVARSAPIKGTRPAGRRAELAASAKDRAENVMIVDLVRNDLGRVCRAGSVRVAALADVRAMAGVWHLVSEVEGELADGVGDADLVRAAFPPGSVTGAPKLAALDVIAELESTGREAYTGAIGFASPLAGLELSVAIRTFEIRDDRIWLGAGGGIVADSDGAGEAREAAAKAAPLLAAIGARSPAAPGAAAAPNDAGEGDDGDCVAGRDSTIGALWGPWTPKCTDRAAGAWRRLGPRPVARPDPDAGLYETLLVRDGVPQRLGAHLARLSHSFRVLYGRRPPDDLAERIAAAAATAAARDATARLRLDLTPGGDLAIATGPIAPAGGPVRLRPVVLPGGLGPHKWADRTLLEAHEADDPATIPLLVDADGHVLEASRASVVVRAADGALHTPPADGRILPGVTAAHTGARPRHITLADLDAAAGVYVASALRGLSPAARTPAG